MATPKTIVLTVNDVNANYLPTIERYAAEVLTPGDFVGLSSANKFTHQANTVPWGGYVVTESEYALEATTSALADTYAADELTFAVMPKRGDRVQAWITDGETIAIGDLLVLANDTGKLVERTTEGLELVVAVADEAVSPSGSNALAAVRIY